MFEALTFLMRISVFWSIFDEERKRGLFDDN